MAFAFFRPKRRADHHDVRTLDITRLYGTILIRRKGRRGVNYNVSGSKAERGAFQANFDGTCLTLSGGNPKKGRRLVGLADPGSNTNTIKNTTIRSNGGIAVGNAGDIYVNGATGDMRISNAKGVHPGSGFTVELTVGTAITIIGD